MKCVLLIIFSILSSIVCQSQTATEINKDSIHINSMPASMNLFYGKDNFSMQKFNSKLTFEKTFSLYDLHHDPYYINQANYKRAINSGERMMYQHNNHLYYAEDPMRGAGSWQNALFLGAFNYLEMLINK